MVNFTEEADGVLELYVDDGHDTHTHKQGVIRRFLLYVENCIELKRVGGFIGDLLRLFQAQVIVAERHGDDGVQGDGFAEA